MCLDYKILKVFALLGFPKKAESNDVPNANQIILKQPNSGTKNKDTSHLCSR